MTYWTHHMGAVLPSLEKLNAFNNKLICLPQRLTINDHTATRMDCSDKTLHRSTILLLSHLTSVCFFLIHIEKLPKYHVKNDRQISLDNCLQPLWILLKTDCKMICLLTVHYIAFFSQVEVLNLRYLPMSSYRGRTKVCVGIHSGHFGG